MQAKYYDGTKLLSMKDINGNTPEIFLCTSNRTAGKTTYFGRMEVNRAINKGKKFMLVYRFNYELDDVANNFFKEIGDMFFKDYQMIDVSMSKGMFHELFLQNTKTGEKPWSCGYAVALNNADTIKKRSHLFSDTDSMLFDEFQSETNHYCNKEVEKLLSIHNSVARGQGKQSRYLPVYMLSNCVSLINPYYTALGIGSRINKNTKFLKGDGWVLEQGFNKTASKAQESSAFNRAFSNEKYLAYSAHNVYLNDNLAFIEKPTGVNKYICTLKYMDKEYGVRMYSDEGIIFCDNKADETFPMKIAVTTDDHNINYVILHANDTLLFQLKYYFDRGCCRFKDLQAKECFMTAISY